MQPPSKPAADDSAAGLSDLDQGAAETDQGGADLDQTSADVDQQASDRDQVASDRDQTAADEDQAASDELGDRPDSRDARAQSARDRDLGARERATTSRIRDEAAGRRDQTASQRDAAARARDELAAALDEGIERLETDRQGSSGRPMTGLEILARAAGLRKRAAEGRARAAAHRDAAAVDRELAANDRRLAALDRVAAARELAQEGMDSLTRTQRRGPGLAAMQRELDRVARIADGTVVVAFVDVDGLKTVNDRDGHAAGDVLLESVAGAIVRHLRSYDLITRYGGDEFVCLLTGQCIEGARERFDQIATDLSGATGGASFTVGLAERSDNETLDVLVGRADADMRSNKPRGADA